MTGSENDPVLQFKADLRSEMNVLFKDDGGMLIWGPASVEVVDKEDDRITADALKDALPQLMRRERLSLEHSDQLVGDIKANLQFDEPKTIKVNGSEVTRKEFPTDVLTPEEDDVPEKGLYVAGEVWDDTQQARETQKMIEQGVIDSYSISGETLESNTRVKEDGYFDDITEIDLSAVTLCEEGMNQKAGFGLLSKREGALAKAAKDAFSETMSENENKADDEDEESEPANMSMEEAGEDSAEEAEKSQEELKDVFKEAAEEVLEEKSFVTESELKEALDDQGAESKEHNDPDVPSDEYDEEDEEKMGDHGEDDEDDEEKADGPGSDATIQAAATLLDVDKSMLENLIEAADEDDEEDELPDEDEPDVDLPAGDPGDDPEDTPEEPDVDEVPADEIEDPDDDEEAELDVEEDEDEEVIESGHNVNLDQLKSELPDDLFNSVAEHLSDPATAKAVNVNALPADLSAQVSKHLEADEVTKEDSAEDDPSDVQDDVADAGALDKAAQAGADVPNPDADGFSEYVDEVSTGGVEVAPDEEQFEKSFEHEDTDTPDTTAGTALDALYKDVQDMPEESDD